jgi:1,2-phenylacetyl-CoA epoxidase catalytic subunit
MRRVPTIDDRVMRARISSNDMQQAVAFIDAALAAEARGACRRAV